MTFRFRVVLALSCAVLAAVSMAVYAANVRGRAEAQREGALERYGGEVVVSYVTTRDVVRGETFTERNVEPMEWLVDLLPEGALVDGSQVYGRTAAASIAGNSPLSDADVDGGEEPLEVPEGLVALSVPCTNESAVGGALAAGSLVDLYVVRDGTARLLCQGTRVLHTNAEGTAAKLSWATVAVEPSEVEAVVAAASIQKIHFVLPSAAELERRLSATEETEADFGTGFETLPDSAVGGVGPASDAPPGGDSLAPEASSDEQGDSDMAGEPAADAGETGGEELHMGLVARWLICSGAREFVPIACALVAAGVSRGIVWEPEVGGARIRAAEMRAEAKVNVIVGEGQAMGPEESIDLACTLAALGGGTCILCRSDASALAVAASERGVSAAVEPPGLARLLSSISQEPDTRTHPEDWAGPCDACEVNDGPKEGSIAPAMRTTGRFPKAGVIEELAKVPDRFPESLEHEGVADEGGGTPRRLPIETEPVTYRPLITLPYRESPVAGMEAHVPTLCFTSSRGGVGKSSLAVLSALALARSGLTVALVDLDFQFGTSLGFLGSEETDGLFDIGEPLEKVRVDARSIARCRTTPESGLAAFEFCKSPEQAEALAGLAGELLKAARAGADIAIVDMPTGVGEAAAQVFDLSDRCLLVTDQRAFSIESLAAQQSLCTRIGVARTKLVTVVNRCDPRHRDEGYLERLRFSSQAPQTVKAVDGGGEVAQMLSIGSAGELLTARNRFALSVSDLVLPLAADLGCQIPPSTGFALLPAGAANEKRGFLRKGRKERKGEVQVECPF